MGGATIESLILCVKVVLIKNDLLQIIPRKREMNREEDAGSTEEGKVVSHFKIRWT